MKITRFLENALTHRGPLYVQYYVTARCNLRCQQCNVIFANADRRELQTEESFAVIDSLAALNTSVLLLTGGEPFARADLPLLAKKAIDAGIHPRIQTNGFASPEKLADCANFGVKDISISLDSLISKKQDMLNGGFDESWSRALQTVSNVSNIFGENTFAVFGCVFSPKNFLEVINVIKFATEIGWWVSLVPAHTTTSIIPRSFSTFDETMKFSKENQNAACDILDEIILMKKNGFNIYDSNEFLNDMKRYVREEPLTWRDRNSGECDAGRMYFAILPDGRFAPCCDWRLSENINVHGADFARSHVRGQYDSEISQIRKSCSGCLYGSYPEISISARYTAASLERLKLFFVEKNNKILRVSPSELENLALEISNGR